MSKKEKRLPINSIAKIIKEAREKKGLTIEQLVWEINKDNITVKLIKDWEKAIDFPTLDEIYILAEHLDINPNELLEKRLKIQDESIHEINPANRRVGGKVFQVFFVIVRQCVKWIAAVCIVYLLLKFADFEERMGQDPEQDDLIEDVIVNAINEYTVYNAINEERYQAPPLKQYMRQKDKEHYDKMTNKQVENKVSENNTTENNTVQNTNIVE